MSIYPVKARGGDVPSGGPRRNGVGRGTLSDGTGRRSRGRYTVTQSTERGGLTVTRIVGSGRVGTARVPLRTSALPEVPSPESGCLSNRQSRGGDPEDVNVRRVGENGGIETRTISQQVRETRSQRTCRFTRIIKEGVSQP